MFQKLHTKLNGTQLAVLYDKSSVTAKFIVEDTKSVQIDGYDRKEKHEKEKKI